MLNVRSRRFAGVLAAVAAALLVAACGGSSGTGSGPKGKVTVGSAKFGESQIIGNMYSQALKKAGYDVTEKFAIGERETYIKSIERGEIDVVPEYLGSLTEYYNARYNGPDAPKKKPLASGDVAKSDAALQTLLTRDNLAASEPAPNAADQNAYAVPKDLADKNSLKTLSDLKKLNGQLVLGGPPVCPQRQQCLAGLQSVYGLQFKDFKPVGEASSTAVYTALKQATIQVGVVFSSDGTVAANNLVVLQDDKHLQQAENCLALYRPTVPQDAKDVIAKVNNALTTEKLQELNKRFNLDKEDPKDLASGFLKDAGLS